MVSKKIMDDLAKLSRGSASSSFLLLGMDDGYILAGLSFAYKTLFGLDEDPDVFTKAQKIVENIKAKNTTPLCAGSSRIPLNNYNTIFINKTTDPLKDTINILEKNITEEPFLIVYNGYNEKKYIKEFCDKHFKKYLVPIGHKDKENKNVSEAVACAFNKKMKEDYIKELKK